MSEQPTSEQVLEQIRSDRSRLENKIDQLVNEFIEKHGLDSTSIGISYGELKIGTEGHKQTSFYGSYVTVRV